MSGLSKIVRVTAAVLMVPVSTFGLYVIMHGHLTPGGGFQGGAVLATISALFIIAYADEIKKALDVNLLSLVETLALITFISLAFLGLSTTFFSNFLLKAGELFNNPAVGINGGDLNTGGIIPLMNMAVGLEVFSALSLIMVLMYYGSKMEVPEDVS
ncbi:MAG: sodium:proton antiporter [Candidatus Altiarchaeales archaeon ex4484_96]|nr:MAG: sodium:proton antiporter [Candidatus Altiarchaeales archaeon ex4484_96]